jgi:hypothetical protein
MTPATDSISVSEPKARMPWTSSGRTTSSCGMCGITNERTLRLPRAPTVPGHRRQRRQQVEHAVLLFHDDLARAHRLHGEEIERLEAPIAVGDDVDGGGQCRHREGRGVERVVHVQGSFQAD